MVAELGKLLSDRPWFYIFLCVTVVVGGPTFLNQMAERYLPGTAQVELSKDVEWIEKRTNRLNHVLSNQKRVLESMATMKILLGSIDVRMSRLEAWEDMKGRTKLEASPGSYP